MREKTREEKLDAFWSGCWLGLTAMHIVLGNPTMALLNLVAFIWYAKDSKLLQAFTSEKKQTRQPVGCVHAGADPGHFGGLLRDGDVVQGLNPNVRITTKLKSMSDADILKVWSFLQKDTLEGFWDLDHKITMQEWAEAVYSEKTRRGL